MPKIKSAKKALRQNIKRRAANKNKKDELKEVIKNFRKSCSLKDKAKSKELLRNCYIVLDKAAKKNLIHKNKARRLKSRLSKMNNAL